MYLIRIPAIFKPGRKNFKLKHIFRKHFVNFFFKQLVCRLIIKETHIHIFPYHDKLSHTFRLFQGMTKSTNDLLLPLFLPCLYTPLIVFPMWNFKCVLHIHTHSCVAATPVACNYDSNMALLLSLVSWKECITKIL